MKSIFVFIRLALLLPILLLPAAPSVAPGSSTLGIFVATSPCDDVSRQLLQIPATAKCEMIKWNLTLYQDANTLTPTAYSLSFTYGLPEQGTNGLSNGGTRVLREGEWTMVRGTRVNPDAVVYQLDPGRHQRHVSFLKLDHNLLHLLDRDQSLAVGNAGWSYTLNRNSKSPAECAARKPACNFCHFAHISKCLRVTDYNRPIHSWSFLRKEPMSSSCKRIKQTCECRLHKSKVGSHPLSRPNTCSNHL